MTILAEPLVDISLEFFSELRLNAVYILSEKLADYMNGNLLVQSRSTRSSRKPASKADSEPTRNLLPSPNAGIPRGMKGEPSIAQRR
jgi:hypothetical protein